MEGIFEGLAVKFAVHEISVYGVAVDWAKMKADFDAKLKALLPAFWDVEAEKAVNAVVDACKSALQDAGDMSAILTALAAKDFVGAEGALIDLVGKLPGGHLFLQALGAA